jgi:hypothetical protein
VSFDNFFNRRLTVAGIWFGLALAGLYLFIFEPGRTGFFPACPFRAVTGFACPGCGSTRGLHALVHGDFIAAFKFNPLTMIAVPFLLYALLRHTQSVFLGRAVKLHRLPDSYAYTLVGVIFFFWVFRNTPFYPFPL